MENQPRPRQHGEWPDDEYAGARVIDLTVHVVSSTAAELADDLEALAAAFAPASEGPVPVVWQQPNGRRYVRAHQFRAAPDAPWWPGAHAVVACQMVAPDPALYDDPESSASIGLPSSSGGRTYPRTYPMTYGGVGTGGLLTATNDGTWATRNIVARIDGPVTNPLIQLNKADGTTRRLNIAGELAAGEYLLLDFDTRTVLLGGTVSRYSWLTEREWFELEPGDNEVEFAADSYTTTGTLTLTWRAAWL